MGIKSKVLFIAVILLTLLFVCGPAMAEDTDDDAAPAPAMTKITAIFEKMVKEINTQVKDGVYEKSINIEYIKITLNKTISMVNGAVDPETPVDPEDPETPVDPEDPTAPAPGTIKSITTIVSKIVTSIKEEINIVITTSEGTTTINSVNEINSTEETNTTITEYY